MVEDGTRRYLFFGFNHESGLHLSFRWYPYLFLSPSDINKVAEGNAIVGPESRFAWNSRWLVGGQVSVSTTHTVLSAGPLLWLCASWCFVGSKSVAIFFISSTL